MAMGVHHNKGSPPLLGVPAHNPRPWVSWALPTWRTLLVLLRLGMAKNGPGLGAGLPVGRDP